MLDHTAVVIKGEKVEGMTAPDASGAKDPLISVLSRQLPLSTLTGRLQPAAPRKCYCPLGVRV